MVDRSYELFLTDSNRIVDANAEEWRNYFLLEEELARRNPEQLIRYTENIGRLIDRTAEDSDFRKAENGDGWLEIIWRD